MNVCGGDRTFGKGGLHPESCHRGVAKLERHCRDFKMVGAGFRDRQLAGRIYRCLEPWDAKLGDRAGDVVGELVKIGSKV